MNSQRVAHLRQQADDLVERFLGDNVDDSPQSQMKAAIRTAKASQTDSWLRLKAQCEKLEEQAKEVENETEGLKERWMDVADWKGKVEDLRQGKFDNLLSLYMGPDGNGSLDRFRQISLSHRQVLFNIEKENVQQQLNATIEDLEKNYAELESAKDAEIDKLRADANQANQDREEAKRRHDQLVQEAHVKIDNLTSALTHEKEATSSFESAIRQGLAGVDGYNSRLEVIKGKDIAKLREILGQGLDEIGEKSRELELLRTNEIPSLNSSVSDLKAQLTREQQESLQNVASSQAHAQELAKQLKENKRQFESLEKSIHEKQTQLSSGQQKIEKLEDDLRTTKQQAQDRERELREKTDQLAAEKKKSEDLGAKLQESDVQLRNSRRDFKEGTGQLSREMQKAKDLGRYLAGRDSRIQDMQSQELGLARFYMEQSGEVQDAQDWISFVRTVSAAESIVASHATGEDQAWTFVRPWKSDSLPLDTHLPNDMMALIIRLRGSIIGRTWKNETVEILRALVIQVEQAVAAPIAIILEVASQFLNVDLTILAGDISLLAHLVGFGLWQLACLIRRRWSQLSGVQQIIASLKEHVVDRGSPLRILSLLIGDDCGQELRTLIRTRQDPHPLPSQPDSSTVSAEFAGIPTQYCREQDIGLLCLPDSSNHVWAISLRTNAIRVIETSRLEYRADLCWRLTAVEGEGEDILIPSRAFRDLDWVHDRLPS
ncbi:hypothetical protein F4820DRAFT_420980 [Hypoxylon rubiginosum]|uniref:Uncharacterized protein n=1 Tax=Hypoxylon rubiginosum TaxID=110542 RepID=A0ACB9Z256_9PEZI|nr:hypothetical protein F4820DRAFT_420980 [Hypoxylon rubiginosum]